MIYFSLVMFAQWKWRIRVHSVYPTKALQGIGPTSFCNCVKSQVHQIQRCSLSQPKMLVNEYLEITVLLSKYFEKIRLGIIINHYNIVNPWSEMPPKKYVVHLPICQAAPCAKGLRTSQKPVASNSVSPYEVMKIAKAILTEDLPTSWKIDLETTLWLCQNSYWKWP